MCRRLMSNRKGNLKEEYRQYTLGLALFDIVPVFLFLISCILIYSMCMSRLFLAGALCSFIGGMAKVIWKLIVVLAKRDIPAFSQAFRVLMICGFALMLLSVILSTVRSVAGGGAFADSAMAGLWRGLTFMPAMLFFIAGFAGMFMMGWLGSHMDKSARSNWIEELINTAAQLAILTGVVIVYFGMSYQPGDTAAAALEDTGSVQVTETEKYILFDGAGTDNALVFYPGARVEAAAYSPLMMKLAENGTDCFLCRLKYNFAMLDAEAAEDVRSGAVAGNNSYRRWYLGGHSLGGVTAAGLVTQGEPDGEAADTGENDADAVENDAGAGEDDADTAADAGSSMRWDGIILLAAYPTAPVTVPAMLIYGTNDGIVNPEEYGRIRENGLWPEDFTEVRLEGGNHAQFGDYGEQNGDNKAELLSDEQLDQTVAAITEWIEARR